MYPTIFYDYIYQTNIFLKFEQNTIELKKNARSCMYTLKVERTKKNDFTHPLFKYVWPNFELTFIL